MAPFYIPLVLLILLLSPIIALRRPTGYSSGPLPFNPTTFLYHSTNLTSRTLSLALFINISIPLSTPAYLALGISEPTSGSMLGSDIFSAEFASNATKSCKTKDRYVPFSAFPLGVPPSVFPLADDCQADGSWQLVRCARDPSSLLLEVVRPLDKHDDQDRAIRPGANAVLYATGQRTFTYHGDSRASQRVVFYGGGDSVPPLPDDVDGSVDVRATNFTVPNVETTYACTAVEIETGDGDRMIVAVDTLLDAKMDMVHHLTLYLCRGGDYAPQIAETAVCTGGGTVSGPLGNSDAGCATFVGGCTLLLRFSVVHIVSSRQFLTLVLFFCLLVCFSLRCEGVSKVSSAPRGRHPRASWEDLFGHGNPLR